MKDQETHSTNANAVGDGALWLQVAGILVAATVLGVIYNSASPLGVRATKAGQSAATSTTATLPPKPPTVRTGYFNETISMTLETPAVPITPAVAPPRVAPAANSPAKPLAIPTLTWAQVKPLLAAGKIVLVDARAKGNYDVDHIPGAVSLPATSTAPEIQAFARTNLLTTAFVTYCSSDSCHMSRQLAELLVRVGGFMNVSEMPGGYAEFLAAQTPSAPVNPTVNPPVPK